LLATACSCAAGLIAVKTFEKLRWFDKGEAPAIVKQAADDQKEIISVAADLKPMNPLRGVVVVLLALFFVLSVAFAAFPETFGLNARPGQAGQGTFARIVNGVSIAAIPFLVLFFPLYGFLRGLKVYEEFVEGAKEGFNVAIRIIPYLVAMLLAISIFRGGGGVELLTRALGPVLRAIHFPPELLPMALMRPLSGSGSLAIFSDIVKQFGPDNLITRTAGTIYGSTETTFYVVAVYFGAVSVRRTRHAIPAGLAADLAGMTAAVIICRIVFG
jgi:spore maturation protein B